MKFIIGGSVAGQAKEFELDCSNLSTIADLKSHPDITALVPPGARPDLFLGEQYLDDSQRLDALMHVSEASREGTAIKIGVSFSF